jgi:hypothetical protein
MIYSTVHDDFDMEYSICKQEHDMLSCMHNGLHTCKWAEWRSVSMKLHRVKDASAK